MYDTLHYPYMFTKFSKSNITKMSNVLMDGFCTLKRNAHTVFMACRSCRNTYRSVLQGLKNKSFLHLSTHLHHYAPPRTGARGRITWGDQMTVWRWFNLVFQLQLTWVGIWKIFLCLSSQWLKFGVGNTWRQSSAIPSAP